VLFINDLPDGLTNPIRLYADDSKIIGVIKSAEDEMALQQDIDKAAGWSQRWLMPFSVEKCKVMHVSRGKEKPTRSYSMPSPDGSTRMPLGETTLEKDLGVYVSNDLTWKAQVAASAAKANRMLGLLKHTFTHRGKRLWESLYKTYVRPHMEHAIQAWSPYLVEDIKVLERVQRRASKHIACLSGLDYEERIRRMGLTTLEARRKRGDMILMYQIHHRLIDANLHFPLAPSVTVEGPAGATRGHKQRMKRRATKCKQSRHFFTNRVVIEWNLLPTYVVEARSVNEFKNLYDAL
jgi:hypothetical protein